MDLRRKAVKFLDKHGYCAISTINSESNTPQSTLVRYANDDLIIYLISAKERRKVANIALNPKVSIVVYGRSLLIPPKSLIIWGDATILDREDNEAFRVYTAGRFPAGWINSQAIRRAERRSSIVFIRIEPKKIRLNEYRNGFISGDVLEV